MVRHCGLLHSPIHIGERFVFPALQKTQSWVAVFVVMR
jgi:hypothetical protein